MKKKIIVILIILAMLMNITACNSPKVNDNQIELLSMQIEELKIAIEELQAENEDIKATLANTATNELTESACKETGCTETVIYQEGYCKFHYYTNVGETALKDFFNE